MLLLKIIYVTDLHGNHNKYKKIINIAIETQAYAVINGGDMFPKDKGLHEQAVYIIHMPPVELGLDVCMDGRTVGSESVYEFINKKQPLFSLHGHIHESPDVSGIWKNKIGDTVAIQPGQLEMLTYVIIDTETKAAERFQI